MPWVMSCDSEIKSHAVVSYLLTLTVALSLLGMGERVIKERRLAILHACD